LSGEFFKKKKKSTSEYLSLLGQAQINENQSLKKADKTLTSGLMSLDQLKEATKKKWPVEFEREERIRRNRRKMGVGSPVDKGEAKEGSEKKVDVMVFAEFLRDQILKLCSLSSPTTPRHLDPAFLL